VTPHEITLWVITVVVFMGIAPALVTLLLLYLIDRCEARRNRWP